MLNQTETTTLTVRCMSKLQAPIRGFEWGIGTRTRMGVDCAHNPRKRSSLGYSFFFRTGFVTHVTLFFRFTPYIFFCVITSVCIFHNAELYSFPYMRDLNICVICVTNTSKIEKNTVIARVSAVTHFRISEKNVLQSEKKLKRKTQAL